MIRMFNRRTALLLVAAVSYAAKARDMPTVSADEVAARYGKPDRVESTEYSQPRPPFVTRMLEYRRARVRIMLLANVPIGTPPPYASWRLVGFQDLRSDEVITREEAERRIATARRPR